MWHAACVRAAFAKAAMLACACDVEHVQALVLLAAAAFGPAATAEVLVPRGAPCWSGPKALMPGLRCWKPHCPAIRHYFFTFRVSHINSLVRNSLCPLRRRNAENLSSRVRERGTSGHAAAH